MCSYMGMGIGVGYGTREDCRRGKRGERDLAGKQNTCDLKGKSGYWLVQKGTSRSGRQGWGRRENPNTTYKRAGRKPATLYPD